MQTIGGRKRQFPQHALEPHAADQDSDQPNPQMSASTLRRILLPIPPGYCDAGDQERPEQREDEIAPASQTEIVARCRGQEMPDVGEGIGGHVRLLQKPDSSLLHYTFPLMESLPLVSIH